MITVLADGKTVETVRLQRTENSNMGVLELGGARKVTLRLGPGTDDRFGDRIIWERLSFF